MARLVTSGAETGAVFAEGEGIGQPGNAPTIISGAARSGSFGFKFLGTTKLASYCNWTQTLATGTNYFARFAFQINTNLDATKPARIAYFNSTSDIGIRLVDSKLGLWLGSLGAGSLIGSETTISTATWYTVDLMVNINAIGGSNDTAEFRLDGTSIASSSTIAIGTAAPAALNIGQCDAQSAGTQPIFYVDDVALNDGSGGSETSWPSTDGKIVLLKPTSDNAIGSDWQQPKTTGADTTNIYDSVDNTPPVGIAHSDADANQLFYIFETTSGTAIDYDANCAAYTTAVASGGGGLSGVDSVKIAQVIANHGSSSATNTDGAIKLVSNPADAGETALIFDNGVAGTWPSNWVATRGALCYAPSVAVGTQPVARIGKRQATTRVAMCDFLGVYVEYTPGIPDLVIPLSVT